MEAVRTPLSMLMAVGVTIALFSLMYFLIANNNSSMSRSDSLGSIRFGEVDLDDDVTTKDRRIPKKPPPPKEPPPPPKMEVANPTKQVNPMPNMNMPKLDVPMTGGGPFLGGFANVDKNAEGDIIPLVRIQPQYPRRAAIAKIEGWVEMEFTITETGGVTDPRVVKANPPRIFDREAIRAILKWKFKPRVIDGQPVARRATQTIDFKLAQ